MLLHGYAFAFWPESKSVAMHQQKAKPCFLATKQAGHSHGMQRRHTLLLMCIPLLMNGVLKRRLSLFPPPLPPAQVALSALSMLVEGSAGRPSFFPTPLSLPRWFDLRPRLSQATLVPFSPVSPPFAGRPLRPLHARGGLRRPTPEAVAPPRGSVPRSCACGRLRPPEYTHSGTVRNWTVLISTETVLYCTVYALQNTLIQVKSDMGPVYLALERHCTVLCRTRTVLCCSLRQQFATVQYCTVVLLFCHCCSSGGVPSRGMRSPSAS